MLCVLFFCVLCEKNNIGKLSVGRFSLTELTDLTELFGAHFELTERLRHTDITEAFQLTLAVTLCDIGCLNVSVGLCVSVLLCNSVRNRTHPLYEITHKQLTGEFYLSRRTFLSLTELTDLIEPICALFRSHRRPPAYKIHRTLLLMKIPIRRQKAAYIQSIGVSR